MLAFLVPAAILVSGVRVSTMDPLIFTAVFTVVFCIRLWGARRLYRMHLHWPTAFALRILRVPVGLSCLWWLLTRRTLSFHVTPKSGADQRRRGRVPGVLWGMLALQLAVISYAALGLTGWVPWHGDPATTAAAGVWMVLAGVVLVLGIRRIQSADYATSRRNAHRVAISAPVGLGDLDAELVDLSMGGAAVRVPAGALPEQGTVSLRLPGAAPVTLTTVRLRPTADGCHQIASLRVADGDWAAYGVLTRWLFHTPPDAVVDLPAGVPAIAIRPGIRRTRQPVLARQHG